MEKNKKLANNLLKEIKLEIYDKNIINCTKCTICKEDFIDKLSRVVITKCGHIFHKHCLQNHIYK